MEALYAIYKLMRPGDLGTDERVEQLFQTTFFDPKKFDLGDVARIKINRKLSTKYEDHKKLTGEPEAEKVLMGIDFLSGIRYLLSLCDERP